MGRALGMGWDVGLCPAVELLGQWLAALGSEMGSWAMGRVGEPQGMGQGQSGLTVPSGPGQLHVRGQSILGN